MEKASTAVFMTTAWGSLCVPVMYTLAFWCIITYNVKVCVHVHVYMNNENLKPISLPWHRAVYVWGLITTYTIYPCHNQIHDWWMFKWIWSINGGYQMPFQVWYCSGRYQSNYFLLYLTQLKVFLKFQNQMEWR